MFAWIELPPEYGWGSTQALMSDLIRGGYHEEIRGTEHLLWITGSKPDRAAIGAFLGRI